MGDLIRREDALAVLCFSKETGQMVCGDLRKLLEEIKAIPSAEPERKWIPVSERLPKDSGHDWVLGQIRETDSGYLWIPKVVEYRESSDDWFEESIGWLKKNPDHAFEVIAWMPLPEPYKGE